MSDDKNPVIGDILGVKPVGEAVLEVTKSAVRGCEALLSKVCLPAAEEFGLLLRDKVQDWRLRNLEEFAKKAEQKMTANNVPDGTQAHPRVVHAIVEEASWADDAVVQDLWSGLLASSCTEDGDDDSNLIFTDLLSRLTKPQARIVKHACEACEKTMSGGFIEAVDQLVITGDELQDVSQCADSQRLDRELDHLRTLGLLNSGFYPGHPRRAQITPTALALHMYARCSGSRQSPAEFFGLIKAAASGS